MRQYQQFTDQQLIHLFKDGTAEAMETLVLRHKDKLYTSIFLLVTDKYLAEDLFQDMPTLLRQFHRMMSQEISREQSVMLSLSSMTTQALSATCAHLIAALRASSPCRTAALSPGSDRA